MAPSAKNTASMRVLLTGASGFIGAAIAHELVRLGHAVSVVLRNPDRAKRLKDILPKLDVQVGDLNNPTFIENIFSQNKFDAVIHSAWRGVSGAERNDPSQMKNVDVATALLESAARHSCRRFIGVGSQAEYGVMNEKISENDPTQPTTQYGMAKLETQKRIAKLAAQHGVNYAWLRIFSTYGPDDHDYWLIPYLMKTLQAGQSPDLTPCEQLWDYLYVDDAARAFAVVLESPNAHGIYNLGSGEAVPLKDIVTMLKDLMNPAIEIGFGRTPYRPDQVMHLEADIARLTRDTGWKPEIPLQEGLSRTVAAFKGAA
jgi:nucleoside-diphosphate-sugar epimerase